MSTSLDRLPLEVLEQITITSEARGASSVSQCSKALHAVIEGSTHIWRSIYLDLWDDPRLSHYLKNTGSFDWKTEVKKGLKACTVVRALQLPPPADDADLATKERHERLFADADWAYEQCAVILLRSSAPDAPSLGEISASRTLEWLKHNVGEHAIYLWPWLIPARLFDAHLDLQPGETTHAYADMEGDMEVETPDKQQHVARQDTRWTLARRAGFFPQDIPPQKSAGPSPSRRFAGLDLLQRTKTRLSARAYSYSLKNYSDETRWGPFLPPPPPLEDDEAAGATQSHYATRSITKKKGVVRNRVNWEHLTNLALVTLFNMDDTLQEGFLRPEGNQVLHDAPFTFLATRPFSAPWPSAELALSVASSGKRARDPRDWAGAEGVWRRVISFMDYRDLVQYNRPYLQGTSDPLNTNVFMQPGFEEAFRVLEAAMEIESFDPPSPDDVDPTRPTIRVRGTSSGGLGRDATVAGTVKIAEGGEIVWHIIDILHHTNEIATLNGAERWQSSAVQVGGQQSGFGLIGAWSPFEHDDDGVGDPAGPFWMWKVE